MCRLWAPSRFEQHDPIRMPLAREMSKQSSKNLAQYDSLGIWSLILMECTMLRGSIQCSKVEQHDLITMAVTR